MQVQKGKDELLQPGPESGRDLVFDLEISVDLDNEPLNFLGKFAQGPKDARFIYVNSGTYAGQEGTCWGRRAKLALQSITRDQVENVLRNDGARMQTTMQGTGRDGGPTCASVKGIEWSVVRDGR
jgi:Family of unknown function (DUF5990)